MDEIAIQGTKLATLTDVLLSMRGLDPSSEAVQIVASKLTGVMKEISPGGSTEEQIARFVT